MKYLDPVQPYYLYLFGEEDGDEGGGEGESSSDDGGSEDAETTSQSQTQRRPPARDNRNNGNRETNRGNRGDTSRETRDDSEVRSQLDSANARISKLNKEAERHRLDANALAKRLDAQEQRLIRSEARDALNAAGAINPRVADLFLADARSKVKIDDTTGEPTGISEALTEWKTANPDFFRVASGNAGGDTGAQNTETTATAKQNATSSGSSTSGEAGGKKATNGIPENYRELPANERKAVMAAYKRSLRGALD